MTDGMYMLSVEDQELLKSHFTGFVRESYLHFYS